MLNLAILATKFINNIRRSSDMQDKISFNIGLDTTTVQLKDLELRMLVFCNSKPADYVKCDLRLVDISNKISGFFQLTFKGNWQDHRRFSSRRTAFVGALVDAMAQVSIVYYLRPQNTALDGSYRLDDQQSDLL